MAKPKTSSNIMGRNLFARSSDIEALEHRGYSLGKKIGKGSYATVVTSNYLDDTKKRIRLACKIVDKARAPTDFLAKFFPRELEIITKIEHPNVIQIHSILQRGPKIFIFMRYAENGDLLDYVKSNGPISESQSKEWFQQIFSGLSYLHNLKIAHRDLKCENILLSKKMHIKLADFGFARYCEEPTSMSETYCGSAAYAAPEVVNGVPYNPQVADIWSIGIILFIMLNASMPFDDGNLAKLLSDQKSRNYHFRTRVMNTISNDCRNLVYNLLNPEPRTRFTLTDIENFIILPVYCITVSESNTKNVTLIPIDIEDNLNRTERTRRLIPYMTYYIPSSNQYENIPPNQMYTIMTLINQKQHYQDQYDEERPIKQNSPKNVYINSNNNRYQQKSPNYRPTIVYTTRHQTPSKQSVEQQNIDDQYQSTPVPTKVSLTPFSQSNKAPGPFRPMFYEKEEEQDDNEEEEERHQQQQYQQQYHYRTVTSKPQEIRPTERPVYPNYVEHGVKYVSGNQDTKYIVHHPSHQQEQRPKYTSHAQGSNGNIKYILQNQNVKYITQSPLPNYEEEAEVEEEPEHNDNAQIKYVNQNENKKYITHTQQVQQKYIPDQSKYHNQIPNKNYITYLAPSTTVKPPSQQQHHTQYIYREQIPQKIYEVKPSQPPQSHKTHLYQTTNQQSHNTNNNNGYEQLEYIVQKQVPYFVPQQPESNAPMTKQHTYTDHYNSVLTTTLAPLLHVNTVAPTYMPYHRNHKYSSNIAKPPYRVSTQAPIQHLTEITSLRQDSKPFFYQSTGPIAVKQIPKYEPIFKPSPPPKIIITTLKPIKYEPNSLADILKKLQETNHLPQTLTPDNIDNSIKTLVKILNDLKKSKGVVDSPRQNTFKESDAEEDEYYDTDPVKDIDDDHSPGPNTGRPGIDYPALSEIPQTSFNCKDQRYKGFFGDPETNCQVWHYCDLNGGQASFLCPNGTIFSQVALTCDWWFNVKCSSTAQLYVLNERLYKYILPFTPKFPEDYSGPLVDKYLAIKFQEMEEKMRKQKKGKDDNKQTEEDNDVEEPDKIAAADEEIMKEDRIEDEEEEDHIQPGYSTVTETAPVVMTPKIIDQPVIATRTTVESEKVEVIEIKSDGSSGHLIPGKY